MSPMAARAAGTRQPPFSERRFHRWVAAALRRHAVGPLPVGDDTAAIPLGGHRVALLTTDALTEGFHFIRASPPHLIGRAAASVSLSDAAAKGGRPVAFLLDLLLPRNVPERWARAVVQGAERRLAEFGAHVVGGDTKCAGTRSVIGTLLAIGDARHLAPRSGARPGDVLVTTGLVGAGGAAALALRSSRPLPPAAIRRLLEVTPRVVEGARLSRRAHAMLDTSDGLAESARILAEASRCRIVLESDLLPIDPALVIQAGSRPAAFRAAFFGGDYELLAAIPAAQVESAIRSLSKVGTPLTVVGRVERGTGGWLELEGRCAPVPEPGWKPFGRSRAR